MTNSFMIEKNKQVNKVLSMVTSGLDVKVHLNQDKSTEEGHYFEVTFENSEDYQTILDRLVSQYNFG